MPLDTTVGGSAADSYVSLAEADGFGASDIGRFAQAWADAPIEKKEAALRRAAREIDAYVGIAPDEAYYYGVQARAFPRVRDISYSTHLPEIPSRVKFAQYLQAAYLCLASDQIDDAALRRSKGLSNYVNPDGTGGQVANDPDFIGSLGSFDEGATVGRIVLR